MKYCAYAEWHARAVSVVESREQRYTEGIIIIWLQLRCVDSLQCLEACWHDQPFYTHLFLFIYLVIAKYQMSKAFIMYMYYQLMRRKSIFLMFYHLYFV